MKLKQMAVAGLLFLLLATSAGCKKTDTQKKNFAVSALTDSVGHPLRQYTYNATGKILQIYTADLSYDFLYAGDKLVTRSFTGAGIYIVDSFFYDLSDRVYKVVEYDMMAGVKKKTTVFIFNADNTINSATVDYASVFTDDEIFELNYSGGKYLGWTKLVYKSGSYYQPDSKYEFLAYDDKPNPLTKIYRDGMIDMVEIEPFFAAYPNNYTSAKVTQYDPVTGLVQNVSGASVTYKYNTDGLPVRLDMNIGNTTLVFLLQYVQL